MRQQLKAGGDIDVLTKGELVAGLREWMVSAVQGARTVRFHAQGTIDAAGGLTIGMEETTGRTGPDPGFMWMIRRIAVDRLTAADATSVYITDVQAYNLVYPNLTGTAAATGYKPWNSGELVLTGNDRLVIANTAPLVTTGTITLTGAALEFPVGLSWKYV